MMNETEKERKDAAVIVREYISEHGWTNYWDFERWADGNSGLIFTTLDDFLKDMSYGYVKDRLEKWIDSREEL